MCFFLEDMINSHHQLLEKRYPNLLNVHGVQSPNECFTAILAYQCWYTIIGFWYWLWCFVEKASTMKSILKSFRHGMDRLEKKTILKKRWQNHKKNLAGAHFLSCSLALLQLNKSLFKLFLLALHTYCNILLLWFHVVLQLHYLWIWTCGMISIQ